jgi:hypothetical protein
MAYWNAKNGLIKEELHLTEDEYKNAMVERPKGIYKEINIKLRGIEAKANNALKEIGIFTFQKFENAYYSSGSFLPVLALECCNMPFTIESARLP